MGRQVPSHGLLYGAWIAKRMMQLPASLQAWSTEMSSWLQRCVCSEAKMAEISSKSVPFPELQLPLSRKYLAKQVHLS